MLERLPEFQLKELFRNRKFDSKLKAVSGKSVEILQTGEANSDTGPDFKHSLVRINGITMRGDIELHRVSSDWYTHNHHLDRNYNSVVLHVVGDRDDTRGCVTQAGRKIETLELSKFLSADASGFLTALEPEERIISLKCLADNHKLAIKEKVGEIPEVVLFSLENNGAVLIDDILQSLFKFVSLMNEALFA